MAVRFFVGALPLAVALLPFNTMLGPARAQERGAGADWPQWRGPSSRGVSTESDLPTTWSASENLAWKAPLAGVGASSPIVWGDHVIVTSQVGRTPVAAGSHPRLARDDGSLADREQPIGGGRAEPATNEPTYLVVEAFNRRDGTRLWQHRSEAIGPFSELHEKHNLATPTPVTDGERIYAWFGNGLVVALDMDGGLVWQRHLGIEYSPFQARWGHGSSPALHGDLLILLCDHEPKSYLLALDRRTGKERWLADRGSGRVSHSTPVVAPGPQGDELLVNSSARVDAYDPATGQLLWHAGSERQTPIPTAVVHEGMIYLSRGYRNSDYLAIRPGRDRDARRVARARRRVVRAVDPVLQRPALHDQRGGCRDLCRRRHRGTRVAPPPRGGLLRVARRWRREDLLGQRDGRHVRVARGTRIESALSQRSR